MKKQTHLIHERQRAFELAYSKMPLVKRHLMEFLQRDDVLVVKFHDSFEVANPSKPMNGPTERRVEVILTQPSAERKHA